MVNVEYTIKVNGRYTMEQMRIITGDCDRCGRQKECIQLVVKEFSKDKESYPDYESTNICGSCIGSMLVHEEEF